MAIVKDKWDGSGVTVTLDSITAQRTFIVSELSGDPASREWQAVNHPEIPKPKDGHPAVPFVIVSSLTTKHIDTSTVEVVVSYERKAQSGGGGGAEEKGPASATLAVGTTLQQTTTQLDVFKKPIIVKYTKKDANGASKTDPQYGEVSYMAPLTVRSYDALESSSPDQKSTDYVGTLNSIPIWGGDERTWLCTAITGTSQDGGITWNVHYEFQFNPDTWDAVVAYRDDNGQIPSDADPEVENKGFKKGIKLYSSQDFGSLGLP